MSKTKLVQMRNTSIRVGNTVCNYDTYEDKLSKREVQERMCCTCTNPHKGGLGCLFC